MADQKITVAILSITQGLVNRGAETFVSELSSELEDRCQVTLISGTSRPPARWPILWRFFIDPQGLVIGWFTLKNLKRLWQTKYEVVIPLNGGWQALLVRLVTWSYGGKLIIAGQSGQGWDDRVNLWAMPDVFVALSSQLKKWAKNLSPNTRVEYIPNGVNLTKFSPTGESIKCGLTRPIILCVGALTEEKRINLTIQAVSKLEGASLLVVGDGPMSRELKKLGNELLGDRFQLTKYNFDLMPQVYKVGDLFTLASPSYRSFEIVIVEAMATNIPVVVNDDPIRREIVGAAGLFVEPTDIDSYAESLKKALTTKWGNKPRKQAENFSWKSIADRYYELMKEIIR